MINLIDHSAKLNRDEETISRLAILLSILEPLLINDLNLERALETPVIDTIIGLLQLPAHMKNQERSADNESVKLPIFVKYAIRCLTSCVRHPSGVDSLILNGQGSNSILQFLQLVRDEEIIANSAKITRILLREDKHYDSMLGKHSDLGNLLLETASLF